MEKLCTKCGERPAEIKKKSLCRRCYGRIYYKNKEERERKKLENSSKTHPTGGICIECKRQPIHNKKRMLCKGCYQRHGILWRKPKPLFKREIDFIKNYFRHFDWIYEPVTFRLSNGKRYTPDFYDQRAKVFIEVVGVPRAYSEGRKKYQQFFKDYPGICLIFLTPEGIPYQPDPKTKK